MAKVKSCGLPRCDGYEPCAVCEFVSFEPDALADGLVELARKAGAAGATSDYDVAASVRNNAGRGGDGDVFNESQWAAIAIKLARSMITTAHDVRNALTPLALAEDPEVRAAAERVLDLLHTSTTPQTFDLVAHLDRQRAFSERTFGPGERTDGVIDHITKEIAEVRAKPHDLTEWIDLVLLAFDGAWRHGFSAQQIADALGGVDWTQWKNNLCDRLDAIATPKPTRDDGHRHDWKRTGFDSCTLCGEAPPF